MSHSINFPANIAGQVVDVPISQMVMGSDVEKALTKAIRVAFPDCDQALCTRHMKQNAVHHLRDKVGS